jgi:hypothetical protein
MGFAELKKGLDIDSSGQLQFHLGKLQGLLRTTPEGNYTLSDEGKEALRIVAVKESVKTKTTNRPSITPLKIITLILVIALVFTVSISFYNNQQQSQAFNNLNQSYNQAFDNLNQSYNSLSASYSGLSQQFNNITTLFFNNYGYPYPPSFLLLGHPSIPTAISAPFPTSPPISKSEALQIALDYGGWNDTTLANKTVSEQLCLIYCQGSSTSGGYGLLGDVDGDVANYSAVQVGNITYRYVWEIIVQNNSTAVLIPPPGFYYVDATTGEIVPTQLL